MIGKNEGVARQVGVERLLTVKRGEHAAFPEKQIGIAIDKFLPGLGAVGASDALAYHEQVGPGDSLVVALGFSLRGGEALESIGEGLQGFENRGAAEVLKRQPDVIGVVESVGPGCAVFELQDQVVALHAL